jgi:nicotinate-nucleotide adenylyltransferase
LIPQAAVSNRKIGVFGGAFDPPHKAHVALATTAIEVLGLDELHIIPTGQAWHKARALSAAEHRLAMSRLAFAGVPRVVVDSRELERAGPSFTIHTLRGLQSENPDAQLYLIMGADQFAAFRQWHEWQAIVSLAIICIADRARFDCPGSQFDAYKEQKGRFVALPMPVMPVSATQIRAVLATGDEQGKDAAALVSDMVAEPVARYISLYRLYRTPL